MTDKYKKTVDGMQQVLSLELWGELQLQSTYRQRLSIIRWRAKYLALTGRFIQSPQVGRSYNDAQFDLDLLSFAEADKMLLSMGSRVQLA